MLSSGHDATAAPIRAAGESYRAKMRLAAARFFFNSRSARLRARASGSVRTPRSSAGGGAPVSGTGLLSFPPFPFEVITARATVPPAARQAAAPPMTMIRARGLISALSGNSCRPLAHDHAAPTSRRLRLATQKLGGITGRDTSADYPWGMAGDRELVLEVDAQQARELLASDDPPALLDIREEYELQSGTIAGAEHIPMGEVGAKLDPERDRHIVLYCAHGNRSLRLAIAMHEHGFEDVVSLAGGIVGWAG